MKLLLDQNLSPQLLRNLDPVFPGCTHVRLIGLRDADDKIVWEYARDHGFVNVSKDSDIHQRSFLLGFPPKIIWIRLGNCSTSDVERVLNLRQSSTMEFCLDETQSFLAIS